MKFQVHVYISKPHRGKEGHWFLLQTGYNDHTFYDERAAMRYAQQYIAGRRQWRLWAIN